MSVAVSSVWSCHGDCVIMMDCHPVDCRLCHHDCSCVICLVMSWWLCHHDGLCHPVDCQLCGCAIMSMAMSSVWPCYHDYVICIDMSLWWTVTQLTVSCVTMSSWLCHLDRYVIFMMDCHHHTLLSCQRTFIYIYHLWILCTDMNSDDGKWRWWLQWQFYDHAGVKVNMYLRSISVTHCMEYVTEHHSFFRGSVDVVVWSDWPITNPLAGDLMERPCELTWQVLLLLTLRADRAGACIFRLRLNWSAAWS